MFFVRLSAENFKWPKTKKPTRQRGWRLPTRQSSVPKASSKPEPAKQLHSESLSTRSKTTDDSHSSLLTCFEIQAQVQNAQMATQAVELKQEIHTLTKQLEAANERDNRKDQLFQLHV